MVRLDPPGLDLVAALHTIHVAEPAFPTPAVTAGTAIHDVAFTVTGRQGIVATAIEDPVLAAAARTRVVAEGARYTVIPTAACEQLVAPGTGDAVVRVLATIGPLSATGAVRLLYP